MISTYICASICNLQVIFVCSCGGLSEIVGSAVDGIASVHDVCVIVCEDIPYSWLGDD